MENLLQTIIEPLVDFKDDIRITKEDHDKSITYHISVHPDDMGKVIGKQGRIAKAIRTIVTGANKSDKKVFVEID
ncbi:KH domain-containing protein [Macrococcus sp. DPC7161]|uniref:KH domain-containing protein n=1 Tax=Macrococcus sp. DPC7161 TaxID=2507060 RepID=UPI00100B57C8|nr:KH domain-containing protein [Macrococcus sp. DPC7161]RXK18965.1 KH domain-containing protein [Macrococcus sp. DPC7161]